MRVTSDFWVTALLRRAQGAGAFATVLSRGSGSAGSIYIVVRDMENMAQLIGPAPQVSYDRDADGTRKFEVLLSGVVEEEIHARLQRERSFDPDIWVIEIEDRQMRSFVDDIVQH